MRGHLSYVLPLRSRPGDGGTEELTEYLEWLAERVDLVIVDGSEPSSFLTHHDRWARLASHVPPADDIRYANGKVRGALTGLRLAAHELVVIADDDVRYDEQGLERMAQLLAGADLVRPQNYFDPLPWHARWDTARILLNRAIGSDFPGTLGVRRSFLRSVGGYDGDVLFENLELIRTVTAGRGRVVDAPALFVRRRPPTVARFLEQRPRQAYDDWAPTDPIRRLPRRRTGRRCRGSPSTPRSRHRGGVRDPGRELRTVPQRGPPGLRSALAVPRSALDLSERAVLVWLALIRRLVGRGSPYAGAFIRRAANPPRVLRRRLHPPLSG